MTMATNNTTTEAALAALQPLMNGESTSTNTSQLRHRLRVLDAWCSGNASRALNGKTILELGCGQGDMTVPLAYFSHKVLAVDPASLDYGSPMTLGEAQKRISEAEGVGERIEWVKRDSIAFVSHDGSGGGLFDADEVDYVVLAHSIWYMESEEYFVRLMGALKEAFKGDSGSETKKKKKELKLLIAEWGLRASSPAAEPHVLAAKSQATNPRAGGNVCNILSPKKIRAIAEEAGWVVDGESWIESPDVEDGTWEVGLTRHLVLEEKVIDRQEANFVEMERAVEGLEGAAVRSMDVWVGRFT